MLSGLGRPSFKAAQNSCMGERVVFMLVSLVVRLRRACCPGIDCTVVRYAGVGVLICPVSQFAESDPCPLQYIWALRYAKCTA